MRHQLLLYRKGVSLSYLGAFLLAILATQSVAQETPFSYLDNPQNPIAFSYQARGAYPAWTDLFAWDNYINMASYENGANDFEKFENARDELHTKGGGVLYYPAGTYRFPEVGNNDAEGRGLMLKTGVVILGDPPTDADGVNDGELELGTKFIFSFEERSKDQIYGGGEIPYPWNLVGIMPSEGEALKDVSKVGIAWVSLEGATVYFGPDMDWGATYANAGAWYSKRASTGIWSNRQPDGTHPIDAFAGIGGQKRYLGAGEHRFVFGCAIKDAVVSNPKIIDYSQGGDFEYYMYKFGARIGVYGTHVFVAGNVLPKSDRNFAYEHVTAITQQDKCNQVFGTRESVLLYDYGRTFGIDVNKGLLNVCSNKYDGYFEEDIIVRNNYVYNHGSKGFELSGEWGIVQDNHNERDYLQEGDDVYGKIGSEEWEMTVDGYFESVQGGNGCLSDNLSRAYDMAGQALWIDQNTWNNLGSNPGNDGESILCQRHGGTDIHSWALTRNEHLDSYNYSNKGYLSGYDVHNQGILVAWNKTLGSVGNLKAGRLYDASYIANGEETFDINYFNAQRDVLSRCPEGAIVAPTQVSFNWAADSSYVEIAWQDGSDQEIGYRVDKRLKGEEAWHSITYRPRQSDTHPNNAPAWRDFEAPLAKRYEYRVVAVNCEDNEDGASPWFDSKALLSTSVRDELWQGMRLFPNPADQLLQIQWAQAPKQSIALRLSNSLGQVLRQAQLTAATQHSLDVSGLPSGFYLLTLEAEGNRYSEKIWIK